MKSSIAKNYIYNLMYQILVLILPLVTTPYLSRVLGAQGIGIYSYTISIVTYFTLFGSLGISMYAQREIAYVQDNKKKRSKILWELLILRGITLTISMIVFYFMYICNGQYTAYYKILLLHIISIIFDIAPFFQGMEEFKKIVKRNLIIKILSIISIFIFIKQSTDVWKYLLIYSLSNVIGNISLWLYLPKYLVKVSLKSLELKKHLKPTIVLFIPQIATQIYTVLDKTMIGSLILDKSEVGYYEQAQKIIIMLLTVITSMGTVMLPRIANKFADGKKKEIKNNIMTSFKFVYFLAIPMVAGMFCIAKDLIPWFLGKEFEKSVSIIYIVSPIIIFIGLSNVIGIQYLLPTKKQKQYIISVILGAVTNLILNFIFIPKFAGIGAAIGTVISEMIVTITQILLTRKEFNIRDIIYISKNNFISSVVMFTLIVVLNKFILLNFSVIFRMFIDVVIGISSYIYLLIVLRDEFLLEILKKIKDIISYKVKYNEKNN